VYKIIHCLRQNLTRLYYINNTERVRKGEEVGENSTRQKEEKCDEIFKKCKLVYRSQSKREEKMNEAGEKTKVLIIVLKKLRIELKQEIAELRKEIREMKNGRREWKPWRSEWIRWKRK